MNSFKHVIVYVIVAGLLSNCKDPFTADYKLNDQKILVVEGFICVGGGITRIKLSRVVPLDTAAILKPENAASIKIEDDANNQYPLSLTSDGIYKSSNLNLSLDHTYRLKIESNEKLYFSDFVTPVQTPPIDSLSWNTDEYKGITIYASTHDSRNATFYYQWTFEEVWEINANYYSYWMYRNGEFIPRPADDLDAKYSCYVYQTNTELLIASTITNASDVIIMQPITHFPCCVERLKKRYSILVTQHALTVDEYNFLKIVKQNSTSLGNFFDPMPSQIFGNIHSISSNEQVIGMVGAYTINERRIILHNADVADWNYVPPDCTPVEYLLIETDFTHILVNKDPTELKIIGLPDGTFRTEGVYVADKQCTDCRLKNGTGPKPDFWIAEDLD